MFALDKGGFSHTVALIWQLIAIQIMFLLFDVQKKESGTGDH